MTEKTGMTGKTHAEHAETFQEHAEMMVKTSQHLQASEKVWGSVAHTLKRIAEKHGWPHQHDAETARMVAYLSAIPGNEEINGEYVKVRGLHRNFYEDTYTLEQIEDVRKDAEAFIQKLQAVDRQLDEGALPPNGATSPAEHMAMVRANAGPEHECGRDALAGAPGPYSRRRSPLDQRRVRSRSSQHLLRDRAARST